jgi:acyl-CoA thioester hydrolase
MDKVEASSFAPAFPASDPFECRLRVEAADIDARGHVNNIIYLHWVHEAASAHWQAVASQEEQDAIAWVILRHEIDYKRPALLHDEITVRTWVGVPEGVGFERHAEILRVADGKKLARARTMWCPINPQSGRPVRIKGTLRNRFAVVEPQSAACTADPAIYPFKHTNSTREFSA